MVPWINKNAISLEVSNKLFALLRTGLGTMSDCSDCAFDIDDCLFYEIFRLACTQGVQAIVWDGLMDLAREARLDINEILPRELKLRLALSVEGVEKRYDWQYAIALELAQKYADNGIRTIVLKGIAASQDYPKPKHRPCGDIDCYLMGKYELGNQLMEQQGARVVRDFYVHSHIDYKGVTIENHQYCLPIRRSKRLKQCEKFLEDLLEKEQTTIIGDTNLESPSPLFNAIFLTLHAQRHFLSEGIALRHLCDWAMLLHKHSDEIDWTCFMDVCTRMGALSFAQAMTRLAVKYIGIDAPNGYALGEDELRDSFLLNEMLFGLQQLGSASQTKWQKRRRLVRSMQYNSKRYKLFYDRSYLYDVIISAVGVVFNSKPSFR